MSQLKTAILTLGLLFFSVAMGMVSIDFAEERAPAIITLTVCILAGFVWVRSLSSGEQFQGLFRLFILSLFLRIVVCVVLHYAAGGGTFAEDDYQYHVMGWKIAQSWNGEYYGDYRLSVDPFSVKRVNKELGYAYVVAFFYFIFDKAPLVPKIFNCFIGSITVVYFAKFAWQIYGERAGRYTGYLCAVFPSMVLWSSLALKDAIASLAIVYVVWHAYLASERIRTMQIIKIALGLYVLGQMRDYMFILVGGCVGLSFFLKSPKHLLRNYLIGFLIVLFFFFLSRYFGFGKHYVDTASFESLDYYRKTLATGNSAIHVDADISSPGKALLFLPIGIAYFLFAPFPWVVTSQRQLYAIPEVLVWYGLFFFFLSGLVYSVKSNFKFFAPAINVMLLITVTYSLVEGNLGTAYRHRAQIFGFYLMFTAVGLVKSKLLKEKNQKEFELKKLPRRNLQLEL